MEQPGWILVAGFGSIGRRHFRNLRTLGVEDVRLLRSGRTPHPGFETPSSVRAYGDLERALDDRPSVVVIANPTSMHVETTVSSVRAGAAVILEKPVGANLEQAILLQREVQAIDGVCTMAYCFRYHPLYRRLHQIVKSGILGHIFHARGWQAHFLPDWHPWEDYRTSYAAMHDLGGGVVRTLDHELDMARWLFGQPASVVASASAFSGLGVEVEDTADMIFRWSDPLQAQIHVSFARRGHERGWSLSGEEACAVLDWNAGSVDVLRGTEVLEEFRLPKDYDLNQMYLDLMKDALERIWSPAPCAAIELADGVAALKMAEAALRSSREGVRIELS